MLNKDNLCTGTRPAIDGDRILMTGAERFDGYEIVQYKGMCWGISMRSKDVGQDCAVGLKQFRGGELTSYTQLGDEARQRAVDRMLEMAKRQTANAIINVEFELSGTGNALTVVHGTAVVIEPLPGYIPTGAVGNILYEDAESLRDKPSGDAN
jgi:uncharacterized protein YbjQ (UPF0145 family)